MLGGDRVVTGWRPPSRFAGAPEAVDRVLVIACAVVWLLVLGLGVAAGVALVDLGRGHPQGGAGDGGGTPWPLYVVIGVSALIIALAIPLLLRARRDDPAEPARQASSPPRPAVDRDPPGYPGPTPARYAASVISATELDRMWLRCGAGVLTAMGGAMAAVAVATHLMAADMNGAAWGVYAVAGVITIAMAAVPVFSLRRLRAELAGGE